MVSVTGVGKSNMKTISFIQQLEEDKMRIPQSILKALVCPFFGMAVIATTFVGTSCSRQCPAYPTEVVGVMPIEKAGRTLCFVSGKDTVRLNYGHVSYTQKYEQVKNSKCSCLAEAQLIATQEEGNGVIRYINWVTSLPDKVSNENGSFIILIHNVFDVNIEWALDLSTSTDAITQPSGYYNMECLADFTSETGLQYQNVYKITTSKLTPCDALYFTKGFGLVQAESRTGKVWSLVE